MTDIVAVDLGGTHARFAIAQVAAGRVLSLSQSATFETHAYSGFESAWAAFASAQTGPLPRAASIAVAGAPVGDRLKLTNNAWVIRPSRFADALGLDRWLVLNDFGALAHAVGQLGPEHFTHLFGPDRPLDAEAVTSVLGPGTGLGAAMLLRRDGRLYVVETEGGHVDFAPLDPAEDEILQHARRRFGRVSVERLVSASGLVCIHDALAAAEGAEASRLDTRALWDLALGGRDLRAVAALDRYFLSLGAVAGDLALAQGAGAVVIAGGHGGRIASRLAGSGFYPRFLAKGRFETRMRGIPIKTITHPTPGLFGAAAAFADRYPGN